MENVVGEPGGSTARLHKATESPAGGANSPNEGSVLVVGEAEQAARFFVVRRGKWIL